MKWLDLKNLSTKVLLAAIAIALWGLLLNSLFGPVSTQAQLRGTSPLHQKPVAMATQDDKLFIATEEGNIAVYSIKTLERPGLVSGVSSGRPPDYIFSVPR
jgi:hypothetical protein